MSRETFFGDWGMGGFAAASEPEVARLLREIAAATPDTVTLEGSGHDASGKLYGKVTVRHSDSFCQMTGLFLWQLDGVEHDVAEYLGQLLPKWAQRIADLGVREMTLQEYLTEADASSVAAAAEARRARFSHCGGRFY